MKNMRWIWAIGLAVAVANLAHAGGYLSGYLKDSATLTPIVGGTAKGDNGTTTTSSSTGYWKIYFTAGTHTVTGSASGYTSASKSGTVTDAVTNNIGNINLSKATAANLVVHMVSAADPTAFPYQGDCELIVLPNGKKILIDGGENASTASSVQAYLKNLGITTIDALVLTHPHVDHEQGATAALQNFTVLAVYDPKMVYSSTQYTAFKNAVAAEGCPYIQIVPGNTINLDPSVSIKCVQARANVTDVNNASAVLVVRYKSSSFIFGGDCPTSDCESLTQSAYPADINVDVYKVHHHGSSYSSSTSWLSGVTPKYAFIPCGTGNPYGHPTLQTLNNLAAVGATVYRADTQGTKVFTTAGDGVYSIK